MIRIITTVVGICVAALALASVATAHKLSADRAQKAVLAYAEKQCAEDPECVKSDARYCTAKGDHKRICDAFIVKRTSQGDLVQCITKVRVSIPEEGRKITLKPLKTECD